MIRVNLFVDRTHLNLQLLIITNGFHALSIKPNNIFRGKFQTVTDADTNYLSGPLQNVNCICINPPREPRY